MDRWGVGGERIVLKLRRWDHVAWWREMNDGWSSGQMASEVVE